MIFSALCHFCSCNVNENKVHVGFDYFLYNTIIKEICLLDS